MTFSDGRFLRVVIFLFIFLLLRFGVFLGHTPTGWERWQAQKTSVSLHWVLCHCTRFFTLLSGVLTSQGSRSILEHTSYRGSTVVG